MERDDLVDRDNVTSVNGDVLSAFLHAAEDAGDEARVESYVCSFISKQPKNSIIFSSTQENERSTNLRSTLHKPTVFAGVP